jgi:hypothetical protein
VLRDMITGRDRAHITARYAASLAPRVEVMLRQQAILGP